LKPLTSEDIQESPTVATQDPSATTPNPPPVLDGRAKLRMVAEAQALVEGETLASVCHRQGVGCTCMYQARRRAREALKPRLPEPDPVHTKMERLRRENQQLRQAKDRLAEKLAQAEDRLPRSVEVTLARLVATALLLLLCPVSTRQAYQLLVVAFGERFTPADNTLARWLRRYGRLARKIMAESAAALLIRSIAADQIYFHGKPGPLCGRAAEPDHRRPRARRELHRRHLADVARRLAQPQLVASDLDKGLLCAVDGTNAHSQAELLHLGRLFPKVEARLDAALG
jgi:transposase-like protein